MTLQRLHSTWILQIPTNHELPPRRTQSRPTPILTQLSLFHEFVIPPDASSVLTQLIWSRWWYDRKLILQTRGSIESDKNEFKASRPSSQAAFASGTALLPISTGKSLRFWYGFLKGELSGANFIGVIWGHGKTDDTHGVDEVTFDAGGLSLSSAGVVVPD